MGDRIEVGPVTGDVVHIALRATTVVTNDNIAIIVPNSEFLSSRVTNWSYLDRSVRFNFPVGVSYQSDPELVRRLLLQVADQHIGVLKDPKPDALLQEFGIVPSISYSASGQKSTPVRRACSGANSIS